MNNKRNFFFRFLKNRYLSLKKAIEYIVYKLKNKNEPNILSLIQQKFYEEKAQHKSEPKIAIFFNLEHVKKSAITDFSVKTFCRAPEKYHVFSTFSHSAAANNALNEISKMLNLPPENLSIFDANNYAAMDAEINYSANIFVLGDSPYNLVALEAAIQLRSHRKRNYLHFHDGLYTNLLYSWVVKNHQIWQEFVQHHYPYVGQENSLTTEDLLKENIRMIKPVIQLTGITQIIVNADNCIPLINDEVDHQQIHYIKAYLPIPDYRKITPVSYKKTNDFIVAHFGIPNSFKHIDILIEAITLLRQKHNVKLLLAGYGVKKYVKSLPSIQQQFILFEESPASSRMLSLMKGADLTVQLRWPSLGQGSGVVTEMLGLGLKCITTEKFMNECFEDYALELPAGISPELLAEAILKNQGKMIISPEKHAKLLEEFSYSASANHIFNQTTKKISEELLTEIS
ncbi:MAG TPA: glycosyltransferase [Gammaproteobacteria bacterium]|nr:glycosyltransferase [Gammaproteobacteria bacterium]